MPAAPEPALTAVGLSKSFLGNAALARVDLSIPAGQVHALLGENGSGKSTLIKVLSGYYRPDEGTVLIGGQELHYGSVQSAQQLGLRVVHQDLGLVDDCSILTNLALGVGFPTRFGTINLPEARRRARASLARAGLDLDVDRSVASLSAAQRTGVAIARALQAAERPVRLLILDEPTATLPHDEVDHLLATIREVAAGGVGVLYVSHRIAEIREIASTLSVLRDGVEVASGPVTEFPHERLVQVLTNGKLNMDAERDPAGPVAEDVLLSVSSLIAAGAAGVDLDVRPGEIVGVSGLTGSGRETLLPAVFGGIKRHSGTVTVDRVVIKSGRPDLAVAAGIAYVPPDRKTQGAIMTLEAGDNLTLAGLKPFWRGGLLRLRAERAEVRRWFEALSVRPKSGTRAPFASFSGGNQQKIVFAKWLRCSPRVLLLDEPTQGVDIAAKVELHDHLRAAASAGAAVVISSTDVNELVTVCNRVLVMNEGRVTAELVGSDVSAPNILRATHMRESEIA